MKREYLKRRGISVCAGFWLGAGLMTGAVLAGTATWEGFEGQMAAHDAAVAAAGARDSAVGDAAVAGSAKGVGSGTAALSADSPLDTRFRKLVESAETALVARPYALVISIR